MHKSLILIPILAACAPKLGELSLPLRDAILVPMDSACDDRPGQTVSVMGATQRGSDLFVEIGYGTGCGTYTTFMACPSTVLLLSDPAQLELFLGVDTDNNCEAEGFTTLRIPLEDGCDELSSLGSSAVFLSCPE